MPKPATGCFGPRGPERNRTFGARPPRRHAVPDPPGSGPCLLTYSKAHHCHFGENLSGVVRQSEPVPSAKALVTIGKFGDSHGNPAGGTLSLDLSVWWMVGAHGCDRRRWDVGCGSMRSDF
jgi:hypothetical protein